MNLFVTAFFLLGSISLQTMASDIEIFGKYPVSLSKEPVTLLADAYYSSTNILCKQYDIVASKFFASHIRQKIEVRLDPDSSQYRRYGFKVFEKLPNGGVCGFTLKQIHMAIVKDSVIKADPNLPYNAALNRFDAGGLILVTKNDDLYKTELTPFPENGETHCSVYLDFPRGPYGEKLAIDSLREVKKLECLNTADNNRSKSFFKLPEDNDSRKTTVIQYNFIGRSEDLASEE